VVGTTTTRALESASDSEGRIQPGQRVAGLFIYPSYRFQVVDGLITNFHLPRSTLIMLVSAFAGREFVMRAYHEAIERKYRFYSYGDAMLIL
jgi:S-adenosylmethionine:tRNA ribosyltransferase-isomerase